MSQLADLTVTARRLVALLNGLCPETIVALDAAGWDSGKTFALMAELARAARCAEKAKQSAG